MKKQYYSLRTGSNPHPHGLPLRTIQVQFLRLYEEMKANGYFNEAFGFYCVDLGDVPGAVGSPAQDVLLATHKENLWPIEDFVSKYSEDDLFDVIEYLYDHVSKPIDGQMHDYSGCGMHWETFNRAQGREEFRAKINRLLDHYERKFELTSEGEILQRPEAGFERIFEADVPSADPDVRSRIDAAICGYRRRGSSTAERRAAVRDLADVLEKLRPQLKQHLMPEDERALFNVANNFGIRHLNSKQRLEYDADLWLSWLFYVYLATIHLVLRKLNRDAKKP